MEFLDIQIQWKFHLEFVDKLVLAAPRCAGSEGALYQEGTSTDVVDTRAGKGEVCTVGIERFVPYDFTKFDLDTELPARAIVRNSWMTEQLIAERRTVKGLNIVGILPSARYSCLCRCRHSCRRSK